MGTTFRDQLVAIRWLAMTVVLMTGLSPAV